MSCISLDSVGLSDPQQFKRPEKSWNSNDKFCGICFDSFPSSEVWVCPQTPAIESAGANDEDDASKRERGIYCQNCLTTFVDLHLTPSLLVSCPDPYCSYRLTTSDVSAVSSRKPSLIYRYEQAEVALSVREVRKCPKCSVVAMAAASDPAITCASCAFQFCFFHGDAHTGVSCHDMAPPREPLRARMRQSIWLYTHTKRCPRCKSRTTRDGGCSRITCPQCQLTWCYLCSRSCEEGRHVCLVANARKSAMYGGGFLLATATLPLWLPVATGVGVYKLIKHVRK